jgi:hypothetical protein
MSIEIKPLEDRWNEGDPRITAFCPTCRERCVPIGDGICGWCSTPVTGRALADFQDRMRAKRQRDRALERQAAMPPANVDPVPGPYPPGTVKGLHPTVTVGPDLAVAERARAGGRGRDRRGARASQPGRRVQVAGSPVQVRDFYGAACGGAQVACDGVV